MLLSGFPRVSLAHLPTRLEFLPRLTERLGGPEIWVKRDDCTGLATGGNKTRKLEFSMGEALELPLTLFYRYLRHGQIGGGANEIQRMQIARKLLRD